jgi:hypothetical protein
MRTTIRIAVGTTAEAPGDPATFIMTRAEGDVKCT